MRAETSWEGVEYTLQRQATSVSPQGTVLSSEC